MPNAVDDFTLIVQKSRAAEIKSSTDRTVSSGAQFTIDFSYVGGFNPAATAFQVAWYDDDAREAGDAVTRADAPSGIAFDPSTPIAGGLERNGSMTGRAPTLGAQEESRTIYGRLTIVQAELNA